MTLRLWLAGSIPAFVLATACGPGEADRFVQLPPPRQEPRTAPPKDKPAATNPASHSHWQVDISNAPVDPRSADFINFINDSQRKLVHPDFGAEVSPGGDEVYGLPVIYVDRNQPKKEVDINWYPAESDGVDHSTGRSFPFYPIPDEAAWRGRMIQGGQPATVDLRGVEDRHMIIVQRDLNYLFELFSVYFDRSTSRWQALSGAFFDLNDPNYRRPEGWASADASGMAIYPSLLQYDEVFGPDEINHATRVVVRATNGYVYPASHRAGDTVGALPMGARLRLKASVDISQVPAPMQKIFRAFKKYGLIVADNGGDMHLGGTYDPRWNSDLLNPAFHTLSASDFEVVQLGFRPE